MELRPRQLAFVKAVENGWQQFNKQLGVAPTGCGKTIMFSHLAKRLLDSCGGRTLILAHRDELIDQAIQKLKAATGIVAEKEKANDRASRTAPVVVASIQTMMRRFDQWPQDHFKLVVCDEAHHSISESWKKVLNHFDGHANVLGVTATPDRGDKRELGDYYDNIAHEISLLDLIHEGHLSRITIRSVPLEIDLNRVSQTAGDFDLGDLGGALDPYLEKIVIEIRKYAGDRKTLCFLPLRATSRKFTEICQAGGIDARHVDGESEDRKEILADFAAGKFQLLSNAMLLTEGYDCPDIGCIVVLRPTRSRPLFAQMVGRGTRIAEGKKNLLLLDFLWLHSRLKIVRPAHLIAKSEEEADDMTAIAFDRSQGLPPEVADQMPLDLINISTSATEEREERLRKKLEAMTKRKEKYVSAEEFALKNHQLGIAEFQPTMKWHLDPITPKQGEWLEKAGVNIDSVSGKGQASAILDVFFENQKRMPASPKQKWVMKQAGWVSEDGTRDADSATSGEARDFFNKRNGQ